jgi:hypothetical protein
MATYLDSLQKNATKTGRTENGAVTHSTTSNEVLNFFALAGAMRGNIDKARTLFRKAYQEDKQLAVRVLFYLRDVRGGQGERQLFRELFRDLTRMDLAVAEKVLAFIPVYGRWDDLISVYGFGGLQEAAKNLIAEQLNADRIALARDDSVSLLAKWLPSENASSVNSRVQARQIASDLGLSNRDYRKKVVALRKKIGLLEQSMSKNEWDAIQYGKIPSQAGRKHAKAFRRHDNDRFDAFMNRVVSGEETLNAGTLFTYEVVDIVRKGDNLAADAFWKSLPDYTNGNNALVVADTSGSMGSLGYRYGVGPQPIDVSVSLALYFAERNTGAFKNYFLTFSSQPELVKVVGATLTEKLQNISTANWSMNTDIQAVFNLLLKSAKNADATAEDMPKVIYIISDMQFDRSTHNSGLTAFENAKQQYEAAGFTLPHIVFWNVSARDTNVPVTKNEGNVTLVSGLSQSTFRYVVEGKTPLQSMLDILNGERYAPITV